MIASMVIAIFTGVPSNGYYKTANGNGKKLTALASSSVTATLSPSGNVYIYLGGSINFTVSATSSGISHPYYTYKWWLNTTIPIGSNTSYYIFNPSHAASMYRIGVNVTATGSTGSSYTNITTPNTTNVTVVPPYTGGLGDLVIGGLHPNQIFIINKYNSKNSYWNQSGNITVERNSTLIINGITMKFLEDNGGPNTPTHHFWINVTNGSKLILNNSIITTSMPQHLINPYLSLHVYINKNSSLIMNNSKFEFSGSINVTRTSNLFLNNSVLTKNPLVEQYGVATSNYRLIAAENWAPTLSINNRSHMFMLNSTISSYFDEPTLPMVSTIFNSTTPSTIIGPASPYGPTSGSSGTWSNFGSSLNNTYIFKYSKLYLVFAASLTNLGLGHGASSPSATILPITFSVTINGVVYTYNYNQPLVLNASNSLQIFRIPLSGLPTYYYPYVSYYNITKSASITITNNGPNDTYITHVSILAFPYSGDYNITIDHGSNITLISSSVDLTWQPVTFSLNSSSVARKLVLFDNSIAFILNLSVTGSFYPLYANNGSSAILPLSNTASVAIYRLIKIPLYDQTHSPISGGILNISLYPLNASNPTAIFDTYHFNNIKQTDPLLYSYINDTYHPYVNKTMNDSSSYRAYLKSRDLPLYSPYTNSSGMVTIPLISNLLTESSLPNGISGYIGKYSVSSEKTLNITNTTGKYTHNFTSTVLIPSLAHYPVLNTTANVEKIPPVVLPLWRPDFMIVNSTFKVSTPSPLYSVYETQKITVTASVELKNNSISPGNGTLPVYVNITTPMHKVLSSTVVSINYTKISKPNQPYSIGTVTLTIPYNGTWIGNESVVVHIGTTGLNTTQNKTAMHNITVMGIPQLSISSVYISQNQTNITNAKINVDESITFKAIVVNNGNGNATSVGIGLLMNGTVSVGSMTVANIEYYSNNTYIYTYTMTGGFSNGGNYTFKAEITGLTQSPPITVPIKSATATSLEVIQPKIVSYLGISNVRLSTNTVTLGDYIYGNVTLINNGTKTLSSVSLTVQMDVYENSPRTIYSSTSITIPAGKTDVIPFQAQVTPSILTGKSLNNRIYVNSTWETFTNTTVTPFTILPPLITVSVDTTLANLGTIYVNSTIMINITVNTSSYAGVTVPVSIKLMIGSTVEKNITASVKSGTESSVQIQVPSVANTYTLNITATYDFASGYYKSTTNNMINVIPLPVPPKPVQTQSQSSAIPLGLILGIVVVVIVVLLLVFLFVLPKMKGGKFVECGECGAIIPASAIKCPKCGADFEVDTVKCSECGAWVSSSSKVCSECGAVFTGEKLQANSSQEKARKAYLDYIQKYKDMAKTEMGKDYSELNFWKWWKSKPSYVTFSKWSGEEGAAYGAASISEAMPTTTSTTTSQSPKSPPFGGMFGGTKSTTPSKPAGGLKEPSKEPMKKGGTGGKLLQEAPTKPSADTLKDLLGTPVGKPAAGGPVKPSPDTVKKLLDTQSGAATTTSHDKQKCPKCGKEVPADFVVCPYCSAVLK